MTMGIFMYTCKQPIIHRLVYAQHRHESALNNYETNGEKETEKERESNYIYEILRDFWLLGFAKWCGTGHVGDMNKQKEFKCTLRGDITVHRFLDICS